MLKCKFHLATSSYRVLASEEWRPSPWFATQVIPDVITAYTHLGRTFGGSPPFRLLPSNIKCGQQEMLRCCRIRTLNPPYKTLLFYHCVMPVGAISNGLLIIDIFDLLRNNKLLLK
ncbi:hypothetical protein Fot_28178 [Forsythia ovata]|uniref:Uncharacterized protein n=1 Tax=Forsythia ovata TaxID=205694 RepID=A0ABD1TNA6_9LAMI